ncbi:MAG: peptidoglycan-binding protein [Clostridia bacterium]|nr:peptidoglycan-binding protein [Clostridia bacterium]
MLSLDRLIADFEDCIGYPYRSPGTNDERGIDCSGMFVRAYRLQGARIYHGSNTIWRKHLSDKGRLTSAAQLAPGMAVFKWKEQDTAKYPDGQGDFCHIGLVTQVRPLRIVHASTEGMQVKADTRIGQWRYWGRLKEVDYPDVLLLRMGSVGEAVQLMQEALTAAGFPLEPDGIFGEKTRRALRQFQQSRHLAVDGVAGPETLAALRKEAA